ncbi:MAG: cytochrome P450 [Chloroflexi bacterium]|nr:cytochrome P450 [Ardenticatenaceae bacterium]MBL1128541.1 cytochrome P450 [Chloroflexota bacterium]NOG34620.1 cytochrome P450 [Chloroflexota bacterium]GIK56700.1 MAG: cytochrome P450 [Chloroflexota bacterium]
MDTKPLPVADEKLGLEVLKRLARERSLLVALEMMHEHVGDAFQITLPGFQPAVLVGPETNRFVLVSDRDRFLWRNEKDPVAKLLRQGILVQDGEAHGRLRAIMEPVLQRPSVIPHIPTIRRYTDELTTQWRDGGTVDMLVEMRRLALLILLGATFNVDMWPDLERMWLPILKTIKYISPGLWIIWPNLPRPGYKKVLQAMDDYLYGLIARRRLEIERLEIERLQDAPSPDLLTALIQAGLDDGLIRDQLLTMLIAGHDTSTASLTWTLYLLAQHPEQMATAVAEVDSVCGDDDPAEAHLQRLEFLDMAFKEALRLYPPIHVGNRMAATDLDVTGYEVQAGTRVMYSIYLAHRDKKHWENPEQFCPHRFDKNARSQRPPLTYVPFGGGPRNCIGATFAQIEAKIVLARILQKFTLTLVPGQKIKPYMGATLEPKPGVKMLIRKR